MERLVKPARDGGVPYLNQDFVNVLQNSNLNSYKSFLETINDAKFIGNSGIIIKGVKNVTPDNQQGTVNFDFTNSMIYLDGDFLEPKSYLAGESNYQINGTKFYLYKVDEFENREKKVTGFKEPVLIKSYFDFSFDLPTVNQSYIEIEIKNNRNYCSRYLSRVLRYYTSEFGQVQMTLTTDFFELNVGQPNEGLGFGDMFGFRACYTQLTPFNPQSVIKGTGIRLSRFLIQYATYSNTNNPELGRRSNIGYTPNDQLGDPYNLYPSLTNYSTLMNQGGMDEVDIRDLNLAPHDHTEVAGNNLTGINNNNLWHSHEIQHGLMNNTSSDMATTATGFRFGKGTRYFDNTKAWVYTYTPFDWSGYNISKIYEAFKRSDGLWAHRHDEVGPAFSSNGANWPQSSDTSGSNDIDETQIKRNQVTTLNDHGHATSKQGQNIPHNNEPPFAYVLYYEKINPYT
jgi:hypothetical protein